MNTGSKLAFVAIRLIELFMIGFYNLLLLICVPIIILCALFGAIIPKGR